MSQTLLSPGKWLNRSFSEHFYVFANSQIKDLLNSFCPNKVDRAFDSPLFSIFSFDELTQMQDIFHSSCSHDSSQQNSERKTNNINFSVDQQLYSLRDLVNMVALSETDTIYVRSNVISTVEHLEPEQQDICAKPKQSGDLRTEKRIQDLNR